MKMLWKLKWFCLLWLAASLSAAETNPPPEIWLTNEVHYPSALPPGILQTDRFQTLRVVFLAETFKIVWTPPANDQAARVLLKFSADNLGHWPARDWRSRPMERRGPDWETEVPVDSLDVPLVYYLEVMTDQGTNVSPMRLGRPRLLGLEQPTRVFWPFLEGFEEGLESWRWVAGGPDDGRLQTTNISRNGKAALVVTIPPGKAAVTIGTTRLRGWHMLEHGATGVSLWIRTREGKGQAQFTLLANAFTTNQVVALRPGEIAIQATWQQVDLPFGSFGKIPIADLDFFSIELRGIPGTEILLDDLQMLGRWQLN
jgi:hypothetical protein